VARQRRGYAATVLRALARNQRGRTTAQIQRILGAHVIANGAGEVIATAVYTLANHMTVQQIADLWCPYVTMAEDLKVAAQSFTRDVTRLSSCAA
jgi:mercuric reductase